MKNLKFALAAAGLMLLSSAASAEVYLGIGGGMTKSNVADRLQQTFNYDSSSKKDNSNAAGILYGGYAFNKNIAVEANYIDFGKYDIKGSMGGFDSGDSIAAKAFGLSLVGSVPLGERFSIDGKIGAGLVSQKYHCLDLCSQLPDKTTQSAVIVAGIGAHWFVTKNFAIRAGYEHFGNAKFTIEDSSDGSSIDKRADYGLLYAGAEVRF